MFLPPVMLLDEIKIPELAGNKVGDLAMAYTTLVQNCKMKNADLLALREYRVNLLKLRQEMVMGKK